MRLIKKKAPAPKGWGKPMAAMASKSARHLGLLKPVGKLARPNKLPKR